MKREMHGGRKPESALFVGSSSGRRLQCTSPTHNAMARTHDMIAPLHSPHVNTRGRQGQPVSLPAGAHAALLLQISLPVPCSHPVPATAQAREQATILKDTP